MTHFINQKVTVKTFIILQKYSIIFLVMYVFSHITYLIFNVYTSYTYRKKIYKRKR